MKNSSFPVYIANQRHSLSSLLLHNGQFHLNIPICMTQLIILDSLSAWRPSPFTQVWPITGSLNSNFQTYRFYFSDNLLNKCTSLHVFQHYICLCPSLLPWISTKSVPLPFLPLTNQFSIFCASDLSKMQIGPMTSCWNIFKSRLPSTAHNLFPAPAFFLGSHFPSPLKLCSISSSFSKMSCFLLSDTCWSCFLEYPSPSWLFNFTHRQNEASSCSSWEETVPLMLP